MSPLRCRSSVLFLCWLLFATSFSHAQTEFDCAAVTQIPPAECRALVTFYTATNGDQWLVNDGWLQTPTPCQWLGVSCNNDGHISQIVLEANQLTGSLPSEWDALPHLTWLQLNSNQLTGRIPPALGTLSQLTWLRLEDNQLTGAIPAALGDLTALESLYLSGNGLEGAIPAALGNLSQLNRLYLDDTNLTGAIPPQLGDLTQLDALTLSGNVGLRGFLPHSLTNLTSLSYFHFLDTSLCTPDDPAFTQWLENVPNFYQPITFCEPEPESSAAVTVLFIAVLFGAIIGGCLYGWSMMQSPVTKR